MKTAQWVGDVVDGGGAPLNDPAGKLPFIMKPDGVGSLFGPVWRKDPSLKCTNRWKGPFKEHHSGQRNNPVIKIFNSDMDKVPMLHTIIR